MSWTEKYRPKKFEEVKGQEEALQKIRYFLNSFPRKRALVLHGSPGTGKTTLAHVIANEANAEIFELNASDFRNRTKLHEILKPAIEQRSLMRDNKVILVDEVDGISSMDWGGLNELLRLIESTKYPVIITANDIWDRKLAPLRKKAEVVQLREINYRAIKDILINILRKEGRFIDNELITKIAINAKGDLRAAINDLHTEAEIKETESTYSSSERNRETDIFNALKFIFKGKPSEETLRIFDYVNMPIDDIILWVEENIPREYNGEELARAYELLSKVDVFRRRIYRQQYWRFLVYENAFLSYGISSSKKENKTGFTSYKKPDRILKIWLNNQKTEKKKSIAKKYARYVHVGEKRALNEFPVLKNILTKPEIQNELKLTEDEKSFIEKVTN